MAGNQYNHQFNVNALVRLGMRKTRGNVEVKVCGIAGMWDGDEPASVSLRATTISMGNALAHRGPDASGAWTDPSVGIGLAHRRLSILDLSAAGHQPMVSNDGRYVLTFNGEIYNHMQLRLELASVGQAPQWRGHSDTETILAAVAAWGLTVALGRFRGMFSFALWDRQLTTLSLARDRVGEKPLYYGWMGGAFVFASELNALKRHKAWTGEIDREALSDFMRLSYVPSPQSIYRGVYKLAGGTILTLSSPASPPNISSYWSPLAFVADASAEPVDGEGSIDTLDTLLTNTVESQMLSDVPVGAFLSGGIDSSLIVAMMRKHSESIETFSIGFDVDQFDESSHARAVAAALGTRHSEFRLRSDDALSYVARASTVCDEPLADPALVPTLHLAELARSSVKVALSGDGGDELFEGYGRYSLLATRWNTVRRVPLPLRKAIGGALAGGLSLGSTGNELLSTLSATDDASLYEQMVSSWKPWEGLVLRGPIRESCVARAARALENGRASERAMFADLVTYLPDKLLAKVDRAAMSVGLETRIPMLDPAFIRFAWSLPRSVRSRGSKWALRQVLYRYVKSELVDRPKRGFEIPLRNWLIGPLRSWAEELLKPSLLRDQGFLDPALASRAWAALIGGDDRQRQRIWNILVFQSWLKDSVATTTRTTED